MEFEEFPSRKRIVCKIDDDVTRLFWPQCCVTRIPIINIRPSDDCLIFIMGISIYSQRCFFQRWSETVTVSRPCLAQEAPCTRSWWSHGRGRPTHRRPHPKHHPHRTEIRHYPYNCPQAQYDSGLRLVRTIFDKTYLCAIHIYQGMWSSAQKAEWISFNLNFQLAMESYLVHFVVSKSSGWNSYSVTESGATFAASDGYACYRVPFHQHGLTLIIPAWIGNHMPSKAWDEITYLFPSFNGATVNLGNE